MKALSLLVAGAVLMAAGPALAAPDWTKKSPIKVVPGWIPDQEGTVVKMVPGASSGRKPAKAAPAQLAAAKAPECRCPAGPGVVKFRP